MNYLKILPGCLFVSIHKYLNYIIETFEYDYDQTEHMHYGKILVYFYMGILEYYCDDKKSILLMRFMASQIYKYLHIDRRNDIKIHTFRRQHHLICSEPPQRINIVTISHDNEIRLIAFINKYDNNFTIYKYNDMVHDRM